MLTWFDQLKLCFETTDSRLTSSDQLHARHGLTSSSYVLKLLIAGWPVQTSSMLDMVWPAQTRFWNSWPLVDQFRPAPCSIWFDQLKLGFETAGRWLTSSGQLHAQYGSASSSYVLKQLVAGYFIAGFYRRVEREQVFIMTKKKTSTNWDGTHKIIKRSSDRPYTSKTCLETKCWNKVLAGY